MPGNKGGILVYLINKYFQEIRAEVASQIRSILSTLF